MLCAGRLPYILLFADEKNVLHEWLSKIITYLQTLRLSLHLNSAQPIPVETGVPFLGFIVFPEHRRLKSANGHAFQRRFRTMLSLCNNGELKHKYLMERVQGWINHTHYGDTWGLRRAVLAAGIRGEG